MIAAQHWTGSLSPSRRATVAIAVILIHVLAGLALFQRWGDQPSVLRDRVLDVFDVRVPPNVPEERPVVPKAARHSGAAAPPNLKNDPTEIVAPPPVLPPIPVLVIAAPVAGTGSAANAGAAPFAGPGTGAGGQGFGRGGGGAGDGDGDGGVAPRQIKGSLKNSDYPLADGDDVIQGRVSVRYRVMTDGRVSECEVTRSSGNKRLDDTTCRLIVQRFRFRPALDERGRPVVSSIEQDHEWILQHD